MGSPSAAPGLRPCTCTAEPCAVSTPLVIAKMAHGERVLKKKNHAAIGDNQSSRLSS
jgi:hypothetical protein